MIQPVTKSAPCTVWVDTRLPPSSHLGVTKTILVRATAKLRTLRTAIQCAMGWEDSHLHELEKNGDLCGEENPFAVVGDPEMKSENKQVGTLLREDGDTLSYQYDFGDSCYHTVTREAQLPPDLRMQRPRCIAGENACPPEDVGGPPAYMQYLEAVLDPHHEEYAEIIEWHIMYRQTTATAPAGHAGH